MLLANTRLSFVVTCCLVLSLGIFHSLLETLIFVALKFWLSCFKFPVISSEAKNILVRHLYQHADEKVSTYYTWIRIGTVKLMILLWIILHRSDSIVIFLFSWDRSGLLLKILHQSMDLSFPGLPIQTLLSKHDDFRAFLFSHFVNILANI